MVRWLLRIGLVVGSGALGLGCFAVDYEDGVIACGEAGCPPGMSCAADGYCYAGPGPDATDPGDPGSGDGDPDPDGPTTPAACPVTGYDPCVAIPALPADPQIDGQIDCGEMLVPIATTYWLAGNAQDVPPDHAAEIAVAWRPGGIYVYALVHEPEVDPARNNEPVYWGDAVEIYVDDDGAFVNPPAYDPAGTRQFVVAAPEHGESSRRGAVYTDGQELGSWSSQLFVAVPTADGYAVEAFVQTRELGTPGLTLAAGETVGFDLAINISRDSVSGQQNDYLGQYFLQVSLSGGSAWPFDNVGAFCTPALSPPSL